MKERIIKNAFFTACKLALWIFERRLHQNAQTNLNTLQRIVAQNKNTDFGSAHSFSSVLADGNLFASFKNNVPLSEYMDYEPDIERIAAGEPNVLTADEVTIFAGSSGTTGQPKRIPRTRRAQRHHMLLIVLANQAIVHKGRPSNYVDHRGINLMSLYAPPSSASNAVPTMSGPNAGVEKLRRQIPLFYSTPVVVYGLQHRATALYLHALFGLLNKQASFIEIPFAPHVVGWLAIMEQYQTELIHDLQTGSLSQHLTMDAKQRRQIESYLHPHKNRAAEVEKEFAKGFNSIVPRLWPKMQYIRTVTTGSFAFSLPRLRWLTGPDLLIHSSGHSSSEGIIGVNLKTDGSNDYVLAVGTCFFEFIPVASISDKQPTTVEPHEVEVGQEYEVVLTSCAGLYRYRLGDIVRISGFHGTAPTYNYMYRRGTILNFFGEKTTEAHTSQALEIAITRENGSSKLIKDYCVTCNIGDSLGRYIFFVELHDKAGRCTDFMERANETIDDALCEISPSYFSNGRATGRLSQAKIKQVRTGTFDALTAMRLDHAQNVSPTQVKTPRSITSPDVIAFLEKQVLCS